MIKYNNQFKKALKRSEKEAYNIKNNIVDIEHLVLGILSFENKSSQILNKWGITYENFKKKITNYYNANKKTDFIFYTTSFKKIIDLSFDIANELSSKEVMIEHVLMCIIDDSNSKAYNYLNELTDNIENIYKELYKSINNNKNLLLYEIGTNLNDIAKQNKLEKVIGRKDEINRIIEILARKNKNNPILIGEAGVGKTALVEGLVQKIENNKVPPFLQNMKIFSLNLASVISGTKYRGEFEEKLTKIIKEVEENENIILFIDEVHTLMGAGGAEGAIDASNILKPFLARNTIKIIGATTISEYKKIMEKDKAIDRRFQKIFIEEPDSNQTLNILRKVKIDYEKYHNVNISKDIIESIVKLSKKYIFDRNEPDRSLDILDEACAKTSILSNKNIDNTQEISLSKVKIKKENAIKNEDFEKAKLYKEEEKRLLEELNNQSTKNNVTYEIIKNVIESKCNTNIIQTDARSYNLLEKELCSKIIGQDKQINLLVQSIKRYDNNISDMPVSILLTGAQGVGKTLTIKEFSEIRKINLVELNMEEFTSEISINKILGSPQGYVGYEDTNTVFEVLRLKPNSIILLKNIELAHQNVINLISNILTNSKIRLSNGEIIKFDNTLIIITSNISNLNKNIGFTKSNDSEEYNNFSINNRINYKIHFSNLNRSNIKNIIKKELDVLNNIYLKQLNFTNKEIENIINESQYEEFGASKIKNILTNIYESELINT